MNPRRIPDESDSTYPYRVSADQYLTHQQTIGLLVKRLRRMNHTTQSDLALRTSTDPSYLSDIERGSCNLSIEKLMKLSDGLDIGEEKLLHMSRQITYSVQLNETRNACNDKYNIYNNGIGQQNGQMINRPETKPLPDTRKAPPYS